MTDKLASLAMEINSAFVAEESARVEAGRLLLKARAAHAELLEKPCDPLNIASLLTFKGWCLHYIKRSYRDILRCMALARSENPAEAVEAERSTARRGMRKTRAKQMTNVSHPRAAAAAAPHLRVVEPHSTQVMQARRNAEAEASTKPEIIQPPPEQPKVEEKWKASTIVPGIGEPVEYEGETEADVYVDACNYMFNFWFGDAPENLNEMKRFMTLMAEFYPDIGWKFERVKPSGADQVKAKVAEIKEKKAKHEEAAREKAEFARSHSHDIHKTVH